MSKRIEIYTRTNKPTSDMVYKKNLGDRNVHEQIDDVFKKLIAGQRGYPTMMSYKIHQVFGLDKNLTPKIYEIIKVDDDMYVVGVLYDSETEPERVFMFNVLIKVYDEPESILEKEMSKIKTKL